MNKKIISIILSVGILSTFLTGCGQSKKTEPNNPKTEIKVEEKSQNKVTEESTKTTYPIKVKNFTSEGKEYEVTFKQKPTKVITTNQPATEIMLALGLENYLLGTCYRDNPILPELEESYKKIPIISQKYPSKEVIIAKKPDMLFGWSSAFFNKNLSEVNEWNKRDINTFIERNSILKQRTVENEFKDIEEIGKIFDIETKANKMIKEMKDRIEKINSQTKNIKKPVKVLVLEGRENNKYFAYGKNTLVNDMVEKAGGTNLADKSGSYTLENIIAKNPDAIALISYETQTSENKELQALLNNPSLKNVNAIKNKKIIDTPLAETYVGGIRTVNGIQRLAKGFYPEIFK